LGIIYLITLQVTDWSVVVAGFSLRKESPDEIGTNKEERVSDDCELVSRQVTDWSEA